MKNGGLVLGAVLIAFFVGASAVYAELHTAIKAGNSYVTFEDGSTYGLSERVDCHVGETYNVVYVAYGVYHIVHPKSGNVVGAMKVMGAPEFR
jgi:hypothetical protein